MPFDEAIECPLCMEPLDIDDLNFYPCTCGYQICRFCWHRIRTDENSLCPACRKQYQEDPAEFKPLTEEELTKIKKERRQKDVARKQKAAENRRHLANIRVVQKNLVFVVGLSTRLADTEVLKRQDYFGKYGKILKVVINSSTSYAGAQGPSASAYITYTKPEDCLRAIHAVNNLHVDGRTLKASLGTTKYCSHFLKGTQCNKTDCMYLHELGDEEASFTKEEMQSGKHQDYEQKLVDTYLTPAPLNPASATQVSNSSRSAVGDGVSVTNGSVSSSKPIPVNQRKKTDSGSSSSNKAKEPWPLLNSNRGQPGVATSKDTSDTVTGGGDTLSNGATNKHSSSSTVTATHSLVTDITTTTQQNGTSHSSPTSNSSSSSNPRTPTPETLPHVALRLPDVAAAATEEDSSPRITGSAEPAPAAPKTLLAARKLPFSDSVEVILQSSVSDAPKVAHNPLAQVNYSDTLLTNSSEPHFSATTRVQQPPATGSFGFGGFMKDSNTSATPVATVGSEWDTSYDPAAIASDDDLGFDPFFESNKGLADMLENETGHSRLSPSLCGYPGTLGLPASSLHHRPPPGVALGHLQHTVAAGMDMLGTSAGIMSSIVTQSSASVLPSSVVSASNTSTLPPPPPGLPIFPQYTPDVMSAPGLHQSPTTTPINSHPIGPDMPAYRGSRMLGLMNLGQTVNNINPPMPHMMPQSPINAMPRSPYNDGRMGCIQPPSHSQSSFGGYPNGISDYNNSFNTQELRDSLKALLPHASINVLPNHQPFQQSRLRNNYMHPGSLQSNSVSWNSGSPQPVHHPSSMSGGVGTIDDQFTDPAIVSGCLSSSDNISDSPPGVQPHWLKSIQQLTENESSPAKQPTPRLPTHPLSSSMPSMYRPPSTHSSMPFAQNLHASQPGSSSGGWPTLQAHNPPPGFQSAFRSTTQNPHMATLESQ